MRHQNYNNHTKYYYPHHLIFYPFCVVLIAISIYKYLNNEDLRDEYFLFTASFILLAWLSFMMRQHYALGGQNRIVRLELRLRYYQLTGQRLEALEEKLAFPQLAALRFASDEELPMLINRALEENLSADSIKKSIKNWQPDYMRV